MTPHNLLPEPPATLLPDDAPQRKILDDQGPDAAVRHDPTYCAAWAQLAESARKDDNQLAAYAFARTGYHRGLDQLRGNGWKGHGPVPWSHEPNRGFLTALHQLSLAAADIGEADEAARCAQFLRDCDPAAADALS